MWRPPDIIAKARGARRANPGRLTAIQQFERSEGSGAVDGWAVMARKVHLDVVYGKSEAGAKRKVEASYLYRARRITNQ